MKILKRLFAFILINILAITIIDTNKNNICANGQGTLGKPIKAAVILSSFNDAYMSLVKDNLDKIQKENSLQIEFTYFDGKNDQNIQNEIIDSVLKENFNLLLVNSVDTDKGIDSTINKVKGTNIPILLFNIAPFVTDSVKSYNKAFIIATAAEESGTLEGKLLINEWNNNKKTVDKNNNNTLEYVMLTGERNNTLTQARTKYSVSALNDAGINNKELGLLISNGSKENSRDIFEPFFIRYDGQIEAIIANDDTIALGALEVLQKYGYNKGDKTKFIPIVGVNGIPEAIESINKGFMTGTVIQDAPAMADALYKIGMNLVYNRAPLEGTNYKFNESEVAIEIPYSAYSK